MPSCKRIAALLVVLLMPGLVFAGDKVKEEETGIEFDKTLPGGLVLVATGVREKLTFDVYAAAAYVHKDALAKLKTDKDPASRMYLGSFPRRLMLQFVRNAPRDKIQEAFRSNLARHMSTAEKPKAEDDIERFMTSMEPGIKKGQIFSLHSSGSKAVVKLNGKTVYETTNPIMVRTMWKIYFTSDSPISQTLYDNFVKGAAQ